MPLNKEKTEMFEKSELVSWQFLTKNNTQLRKVIEWADTTLFRREHLDTKWYGTVTYPFMDSSKFYINWELSTLEDIGYSTDIRLTSKPSLRHHFSLYLVTSIYL